MVQKNKTGWNPSKRNKKIGTEDQGFKNRNDFDIPASWNDDRIFWEKLNNPVIIKQSLGNHNFVIFIEPTTKDFKHYVSVDEIIKILGFIPERDRIGIKSFVLRQPKRKEYIFSRCWGRMGYWADFGEYSGVTVMLEACPLDYSYKIDKSISPDTATEIDKLREEGHIINRGKREYEIMSSPQAIRNTQLFRTLIHEIGHHLDYLEKVVRPYEKNAEDLDYAELSDLYHARADQEKEHYAEKYAAKIVKKLKADGKIPFDPIPAETHPDINPDWFYFKN